MYQGEDTILMKSMRESIIPHASCVRFFNTLNTPIHIECNALKKSLFEKATPRWGPRAVVSVT